MGEHLPSSRSARLDSQWKTRTRIRPARRSVCVGHTLLLHPSWLDEESLQITHLAFEQRRAVTSVAA